MAIVISGALYGFRRGLQLFTVFLFLAMVFTAGALHAQDDRAKLTVRVTDQGGAVVPSASLTLTRGSTGTSTTANTNGTGTYTFLYLDPDT